MLARFSWLLVIAIAGCSLERVGFEGGRDASTGPPDGGSLDGGHRDGGRRCEVGGCDDGNVCTNDVCNPSIGCVNTPVPGSCDDDVLCNGADSCAEGTCSVHDGVDPCPGSSFCDATSDMCTGCEDATDCPAEMIGDWGACAFPSNVCATMGMRTRTVTSYTCSNGGTCEPSARAETEPCVRGTDGIACGVPTTGAWSACTYLDTTCSTSGSRTRTISTPTCASGSCAMIQTIETDTAGCARTTDGVMCGAPIPGAWSLCGGYDDSCDESGTQSRTITTPRCNAGTCTGSTTAPEMRACSRDTDGLMCGAETCTDYGLCVRTSSSGSACMGNGVQTRRCTGAQCSAGTCAMSGVRIDERACFLGGDPCERGRTCGACQPLVGTTCTRGAAGYRECTIQGGTCGMGGCGGNSADVTIWERCTCP
ncbi:hypothetical protein [Sandaracinus amylolyticus]|uniref:hypothetical protein n=1 Tax=Sandaracinus amylolyticus TaxID=927083 RepID=UPI001F3C4778|nr:hypothetical protein [Sandaracinus amylolyticus]UJR85242.1 Hypothetical protein I5071_73220 [Sandaracinus amylolyticus]